MPLDPYNGASLGPTGAGAAGAQTADDAAAQQLRIARDMQHARDIIAGRAPNPYQETPGAWARVGRGAEDVWRGAKLIALEDYNALNPDQGATDTIERALRQNRDENELYQRGRGLNAGIDWLRTTGQLAAAWPTGLLGGVGAGLTRAATAGALGGGTYGAATAAADDGDIGRAAITGAAGGAALGAGLGLGGRALRSYIAKRLPLATPPEGGEYAEAPPRPPPQPPEAPRAPPSEGRGISAPANPANPDLDAPNFGLPKASRTLPDDHPLLQPTHLIDTPERNALRDAIVQQHFEDVQPVQGRRPIAYIMGGGGGSGKSSVLQLLRKRGLIPEADVVEINPDRIKTGDGKVQGLPEFPAIRALGDSRAAQPMLYESAMLANRVLERAVQGGYDVILDRTLGNVPRSLTELSGLKNAGYELRLYGVTVDPRTALVRALRRGVEGGRYVPPEALLQAHKGFANGFEHYAELADRAWLYDNDVPIGAEPIRIAEKVPNRGLYVEDEARYNQFVMRRYLNEQAQTLRQVQPR